MFSLSWASQEPILPCRNVARTIPSCAQADAAWPSYGPRPDKVSKTAIFVLSPFVN